MCKISEAVKVRPWPLCLYTGKLS